MRRLRDATVRASLLQVDTSSLFPFAMRLTDLWDGLVSKPASAEDAAARVAREAAEGRRRHGLVQHALTLFYGPLVGGGGGA